LSQKGDRARLLLFGKEPERNFRLETLNADAVGADDPEMPFAGFPDRILLQLQVTRFSETGGEEMNEFNPLADGCFDNVNRLLDRRGDNGKIDGFRQVINGRIGLDAAHFRSAGVNGIKSAGKTVCLHDLEIRQFPSAKIFRRADDGHTFGIK